MTNETNVEELLPCPFCGGEAVYFPQKYPDKTFHAVKCKTCFVVWEGHSSKVAAYQKWNTRAPLTRQGNETAQKYPCSEKCIETTVCDDSCHLFEKEPPQGEEEDSPLWNKFIDGYRKQISALTAELAALRSQLSEAQAWKESMLAVTPDMQKIGKLLNVKLGESVHDKIIPGIEKLQQEVAEAQGNYEKVWDAAIKRDYYEKYSAMELWQHLEIPPDKTTFINNLKKGKE
jgi:Lar family restriction alleviation protein